MPKITVHTTFLWLTSGRQKKETGRLLLQGEVRSVDFIEISIMKPDEFDALAHKRAHH